MKNKILILLFMFSANILFAQISEHPFVKQARENINTHFDRLDPMCKKFTGFLGINYGDKIDQVEALFGKPDKTMNYERFYYYYYQSSNKRNILTVQYDFESRLIESIYAGISYDGFDTTGQWQAIVDLHSLVAKKGIKSEELALLGKPMTNISSMSPPKISLKGWINYETYPITLDFNCLHQTNICGEIKIYWTYYPR